MNIFPSLLSGATLSRQEAHDILIGITQEQFTNEQIAAMLAIVQQRGATVDEMLGLRDGILETGVPVRLDADRYIDIVGTGGDMKNTFNISTAACFVLAGAGYKVAKHGNVSATSTSGSSNVLAQHGVQFSDDPARLNRSLAESGMTYLHAPFFARAMKFVGPVRRALPFATCFNLLGPLVNPSRPPVSCFGTATLAQMRLYQNICRAMGTDFAIVNSVDGYDEISLTADFKVCTNNSDQLYRPEDLGLQRIAPEALRAGSTVEEAAKVFDSVLDGSAPQACRDTVVANAAVAMQAYDKGREPIADCIARARESLDSGKALEAFKKFVEINK